MEESQSPPEFRGDRSQETAETLRALREQANQKLDEHRRRISDIESDLNQRVELIAQELARDQVESEGQQVDAQQQSDELRNSLQSLAESQSELESLCQQLERRDELLAERDERLAQQNGELESLRHGQHEDRSLSDHLAELLAGRDAQLADQISEMDALRQRQYEDQSHREQQERQLAGQESRLADQADELDNVRQQRDQLQHECAQLGEEEAAVHKDLEQARADAAQAAQQQSDALASAEQDGDQLRQQLDSLQAVHATTLQELESAAAKNDQAAELLRETEQRFLQLQETSQSQETSQGTSQSEEQWEELQRKSELALADVHELKRKNAELREELVRRPETSEQESSEVVSLRAERDALAARIEEIENAPSPEHLSGTDTEAEQQAADLQRRFEMAVEDVRDLKQENKSLLNQLANIQNSAASQAVGGELSWEAQKEQLMRQLAEEDGDAIDAPRCEERATIEGTITITDRIVAEKDSKIAQLERQLENQPEPGATKEEIEELKRSLRDEILGDEESVRVERERLQQLQKELQGQLREAELEISVERAKLARENANVDEKLSRLQSVEPADAPEAAAELDDGSKPRRRWLSALGLGEEGTNDE